MKYIFTLFLLISLFSCTENSRAKNFGGTQTIKLEKGYKLLEATWKNDNLWMLLQPVDTSHVARTLIFKEQSNFGIAQGKIVFVERN